MNNRSKLSTVQTVILIGTALYIFLPDLFIGPIDDSIVALIAGIAELVLGFAKSRVSEPTPYQGEWEEY